MVKMVFPKRAFYGPKILVDIDQYKLHGKDISADYEVIVQNDAQELVYNQTLRKTHVVGHAYTPIHEACKTIHE